MAEKYNRATIQRPKGNRLLDAQVATLDIPSLVKQIKEEPSWRDSDRNAITIFKSEDICLVLTALHAGAEMDTADSTHSIQVLEGRIRIHVEQRSLQLTAQQILVLHRSPPSGIAAEEESVLLLTLTN